MDHSKMEREIKLAQVLMEGSTINPTITTYKDYFAKLEKLLIQKTKSWWDHNTLKTYVNKNMIPKSKKIPTTVYKTIFMRDRNVILTDSEP